MAVVVYEFLILIAKSCMKEQLLGLGEEIRFSCNNGNSLGKEQHYNRNAKGKLKHTQ